MRSKLLSFLLVLSLIFGFFTSVPGVSYAQAPVPTPPTPNPQVPLSPQNFVVHANSELIDSAISKAKPAPAAAADYTTILSEDFEGAFPGPWQLWNNGPANTWSKSACRAYSGSYSGWAVGGGADGATLSCGSNYPDNVNSWMYYGPFSLVGATAADLTFNTWLNSESSHDYIAQYATIDGLNWYGTKFSGNSNGWASSTFDLSNVYTLGNLLGQPQVWIALVFTSDAATTLAEGAYVDDIVLRKNLGTSPASFGKTSPTSGSSLIPTNPTLTWASSTNADYYQYCYDTSHGDTCTAAAPSWTSTGTTTNAALSNLAYSTTYYWQARAVKIMGSTTTYADDSPTAFWSFTTQAPPPPGPFGKTLPTSGSSLISTNPTLSWAGSTNAASYEYCYDTNHGDTCTATPAWTSAGTNTSAALSGLAFNTPYYWQVRAVNGSGTKTYADGSSTAYWSFTTQGPAAPGAFTKLAPGNGSTGDSINPTLFWTASAAAVGYTYCIDKVHGDSCTSPSSWITAGTNTSAALSGLDTNTTYYWQVRATNSVDTTFADGSSTSFWSFTTQAAPVDNTIVQIAAGNNHTCVLFHGGKVKCWGRNDDGQLGDGTTIDRPVPVAVQGIVDATAISLGDYHSCALLANGQVKCWGYNTAGELGDGTTINHSTPVEVSGITSVIALGLGRLHSCALVVGGGVKCWGYNFYGQLGNGDRIERDIPTDVSGLTSGVIAISAGGDNSCAITNLGLLKCWGYIKFSTTGYSYIPVDVVGLSGGVSLVDTGNYDNCELTFNGAATCWGDNTYGQLGTGDYNSSSIPKAVIGLAGGVSFISVGYYHSCAISIGVAAKCWGYNFYGQLGDNTTLNRNTPVDIFGIASGARAVAAGGSHTCVLMNTGGVKCWGSNSYGQLGDSTTTDRNLPVDVGGLLPSPLLNLSIPTYNFGDVLTGTTSRPVSIEVKNVGDLPLNITDMTVSAGFADIHSCRPFPAVLSPGEICFVTVVFNPQTAGTVSGNLTITSNTAIGNGIVTLSGHAIASQYSFFSGNQGSYVAFSVTGSQWHDFATTISKGTTCDPFGQCTSLGYVSASAAGPGDIVDGQFSFTGSNLTFQGQFTDSTTASGSLVAGTNPSYPRNWTATYQGLRPLIPGVIDPALATELHAPDASVSLNFPSGAVTAATTATLTILPGPSLPIGNKVFVGRAFKIEAVDGSGPVTTLSKPYTLTLRYTENDWRSRGIPDEQSLKVYMRQGSQWISVFPCASCTLDTVKNEITLQLQSFGEFVLVYQHMIYLPAVLK